MTKTDETRRNLFDLTDTQRTAIGELVAGATATEAADTAGVTRQTVSKWKNHHPEFIAELNRRRAELIEERTDRMRDIDVTALGVIGEHINEGNLDAALGWVKHRKLSDMDEAVGPVTATAVLEKRAVEVLERPEHQPADFMDEFRYMQGTTPDEARKLAEAELVHALDDTDD